MTTTGKVLVGIIVLIIVAGGAYYWYAQTHNPATAAVQVATTTSDSAQEANTLVSNTPVLPSGSGTSDASLSQDTAALDAQMSGLSADTASANQSVNDKPISQ